MDTSKHVKLFLAASLVITMGGGYLMMCDHHLAQAAVSLLTWRPARQDVRLLANLTNGMAASAVIGQPDFTSKMNNPIYDLNIADSTQNDFAFDVAGGRVFISDPSNNRVLVYPIDADWTSTMSAPLAELGQADFLGFAVNRGGAVAANTMNQPNGLAWDAGGSRLFVADTYNNRVLVFDLAGGLTSGMDATVILGQTTASGSNYGTTPSTVYRPFDVDWDDGNSRLFVADAQNYRVLAYTGTMSTGMDASLVLGQASFTVRATGVTDKMFRPLSIAWDAGNSRLFVADLQQNRVLGFTGTLSNYMSASLVLGQANFTSSSANRGGSAAANTMSFPNSVAWDASLSRLFVADRANNRVLVFTGTLSNGMSANAALGQGSLSATSANHTATTMSVPSIVAWDPADARLLVTDSANGRIVGFTAFTTGAAATSVINQLDYMTALAGTRRMLGFSSEQGATVDVTNHRLFVADSNNNRVLVFALNADGSLKTGLPYIVLGQTDFTNTSYGTSANRMYTPIGVAWDEANGRLFVSEYSNNRVVVFTGNLVTGMNATYYLGQTSVTVNTSGSTAYKMFRPWGLAWDAVVSRLFVIDAGNSRVMVFPGPFSAPPTANAATVFIGQATSTGTGSGTSVTTLSFPYGIAWDAINSRLFVCDTGNNRVLAYTGTLATGMNASFVLGQSRYDTGSANGGGAVSASGLSSPRAMALDAANERLFVPDYNNNRVLAYDVRPAPAASMALCAEASPTTGLVSGTAASCVLGQATMSGFDRNLTQSGLVLPVATAWNSLNNHLVVDELANRLISYDLKPDAEAQPLIGSSGNATQTSVAGDAAPSVDSVVPSDASGSGSVALPDAGFTLNEGTTRALYVRGTVSDLNGCEDLQGVAISVYRSGSAGGAFCTPDKNDCYNVALTRSQLSGCLGAGDADATFEVSFDVANFADPTDAGSPHDADTWKASATATDAAGATGTLTADFEVQSLAALSVAPATMDYGTVALGATSSQQTLTFTNVGNRGVNSYVRADGPMRSSLAGFADIPTGAAHFSVSPAAAWAAGSILAVTDTDLPIALAQQVADAGPAPTAPAYFYLKLPASGIRGTYTNTLLFTAYAR